MADNFEELGFKVKVEGADSTVSHLDKIVIRAEKLGITINNNVKYYKREENQLKRNVKGLTSYLSKLTSTVVIARKLGNFIKNAIQESANYIENLNLFAVAYGDAYEETLNWALNIANAYGLASNEVIKFSGTFRQLSTSLGLVENTATSVSKTVTQLGYDISALFNTSVEKAMETLQSSIFSGNVRPLRAYGIDISQNQIDALFETNNALKSLGVNARNLSQSDKVLARLIITLQTGSNAFGTMNREIDKLQSQIRILQGSFSNFKLAIGDLVQKPVQNALVWLNGLIIAATTIIRAFVHLQEEDEAPAISNLGEEAEEANESIEKLNGSLADFDKFSVLNENIDSGIDASDISITEILTEELKKQQELYDAQLSSMGSIENKATEAAKTILNWLLVLDEEGNIVFKEGMPIWTDNAKLLAQSVELVGFTLLAIKSPLIAVAALFAKVFVGEDGEDIREKFIALGEKVKPLIEAILPTLIDVLIKVANFITDVVTNIVGWIEKNGLLEEALLILIAIPIVRWLSDIIGTSFGVTGGILGVIISMGQLIDAFDQFKNGNYGKAFDSIYDSSSNLLLSLGLLTKNPWVITISLIMKGFDAWYEWIASTMPSDYPYKPPESFGDALQKGQSYIQLYGDQMLGIVEDWLDDTFVSPFRNLFKSVGFANGGYTNANFIMTHENGKREWVGKAAGSSAIVNDTQMSDIMEVAVAKGVYNALSARSAMGGNAPTNETIVIKIGEEEVFNAVKKTANKQGLGFANI